MLSLFQIVFLHSWIFHCNQSISLSSYLQFSVKHALDFKKLPSWQSLIIPSSSEYSTAAARLPSLDFLLWATSAAFSLADSCCLPLFSQPVFDIHWLERGEITGEGRERNGDKAKKNEMEMGNRGDKDIERKRNVWFSLMLWLHMILSSSVSRIFKVSLNIWLAN